MSFLQEAGGEIHKIPWWAWAGGAVALLFFGSHLLSQNSGSGTASADAAGTSGGSGGSVGDIGTAGPPPPSGGSSGSGTTTPTPSPTPAPSPTGTTTYTVKTGDTLNSIASRYHVDEQALYSLNSGTIEATAKAHNFASSDHGHWIFPGEVLKIPA